MTTYDNIIKDIYKYPSLPKIPATPTLFLKKVSELTQEEISLIPAIKEQYEKEMEIYEEEKKAYLLEVAKIEAQFKHDLEQEFGTLAHPKALDLWNILWNKHSPLFSSDDKYRDDLGFSVRPSGDEYREFPRLSVVYYEYQQFSRLLIS